MRIALLKSLLSLAVLAITVLSMWSMLEVWGPLKPGRDIGKMKALHRLSGMAYAVLFIVITYFCLSFMALSRAEPSPRAIFHGVFSISIILLFLLKMGFIRIWKKYYAGAQLLGILIGLLTFAMVGTSAGYYFLITKMGTETFFDEQYMRRMHIFNVPSATSSIAEKPSSDPALIAKGRMVFQNNCSPCHTARSTRTIIGPGLQGVLKRQTLPVSGRPAIPENIRRQIITPFRNMPSYSFLSPDEIDAVIAYLNST